MVYFPCASCLKHILCTNSEELASDAFLKCQAGLLFRLSPVALVCSTPVQPASFIYLYFINPPPQTPHPMSSSTPLIDATYINNHFSCYRLFPAIYLDISTSIFRQCQSSYFLANILCRSSTQTSPNLNQTHDLLVVRLIYIILCFICFSS